MREHTRKHTNLSARSFARSDAYTQECKVKPSLASTRLRTGTHTHTRLAARMHAHISACMHICVSTHTHDRTQACVSAHADACSCTHPQATCLHLCTGAHTHTHWHTRSRCGRALTLWLKSDPYRSAQPTALGYLPSTN